MHQALKRKHIFPWRAGNQFALLVDAERFYPDMLEAIRQARQYILFEMYLFESGRVADRFIGALAAARARGVTVRLLLDAYGSLDVSRKDRQRLMDSGVELVFYNPLSYTKRFRNLLRDHRKMLVVDGDVAFVGGAGICDEFDMKQNAHRSWRETMVRVRGPCVADWCELFHEVWRVWSNSDHVLPLPPELAHSSGQWGHVVFTQAHDIQHILRAVVTRIRRAQHRVWIATAYFVPSLKVKRALRQAARRGVDVRLLLPGPYSDHPAVSHVGRRAYHRLLRHGVRIFEYQPRFTHSKVALCDDWVTIGSSNIDRWNLTWNLEANQEVDDADFAAQVAAMFQNDFKDSEEKTFEAWIKRPPYQRFLEWFWGLVDAWLERLSRVRRRGWPPDQ